MGEPIGVMVKLRINLGTLFGTLCVVFKTLKHISMCHFVFNMFRETQSSQYEWPMYDWLSANS